MFGGFYSFSNPLFGHGVVAVRAFWESIEPYAAVESDPQALLNASSTEALSNDLPLRVDLSSVRWRFQVLSDTTSMFQIMDQNTCFGFFFFFRVFDSSGIGSASCSKVIEEQYLHEIYLSVEAVYPICCWLTVLRRSTLSQGTFLCIVVSRYFSLFYLSYNFLSKLALMYMKLRFSGCLLDQLTQVSLSAYPAGH